MTRPSRPTAVKRNRPCSSIHSAKGSSLLHAMVAKKVKVAVVAAPADVPSPPRGGGAKQGKMPKMNASERAKFYRRRIREYTGQLEETETILARHVNSLQVVRFLQHHLLDLSSFPRHQILAHVWHFMDKKKYLAQHILANTKYDITAIDVSGTNDGIIIRMDAMIRGKYSRDTIEKQLYAFVPGNTQLLDKLLRSEIVFQSSFRFYFNSGGSCIQESAETDFVGGLMQSIGCPLRDIRCLVDALGNPAPLNRFFHHMTEAELPPFLLMELFPQCQ